MAQPEIHASDIGVVFSVTVKDSDDDAVDISASVVKEFYFLKPSDVVLTKAAAWGSDGSDGVLQYTTIAGDINEAGRWRLQAHISDASSDLKTNIVNFDVYGNLA